jgi:hypothetical protein
VFRHILTDEPKTIPDEDLRKLVKDPLFKFLTPAEVIEVADTGLPPTGPGIVFLEDIKSVWERNRVAKYEKYAVAWDRAGRRLLKDRVLAPIIARARCAASSRGGSRTAARSAAWSATRTTTAPKPRRSPRLGKSSTSITSTEPSLRATRIDRHSRVNSSTTFSIQNLRPSRVRSSTKS